MKISLLLLYENLSDKRISLKMEESPGPRFEKIRILPPSTRILTPNTLYVDVNECLSDYDCTKISSIPIVTSDKYKSFAIKNGLFVSKELNLSVVFESILEIFERFQEWSNLVKMELIKGPNLQAVFNLSSMVTPDTVYLANVSMQRYVHSVPTLMDDISAIWRYQFQYGYLPIHIMNKLITSGELDTMNRFKRAFTCPTYAFNLPYTCRNIFSGNTLKAHIFIVSIYSNPNQTHKEIADELGDLLTPYVCANNTDFFSQAGQVYEKFFQDLLNRRVHNDILIQQQIAIFDWKIHDTYSILVIDVNHQHQDRIQFLIEYFCNERDCKAFENDSYIIGIFHVKSKESKTAFFEKVKNLLNKMNLKGAFSKNFSNICDMDIYYKQAADILQFGIKNETKKVLFLQEEFGLYSVFYASLENHNAYELCHPDIISLYQYDQENNTDYLETLYQYLINDRNSVQAAKKLYIHRNTMNYRLEKLRSLISFDEEDSVSKFYVLMSIFLLKYQLEEVKS